MNTQNQLPQKRQNSIFIACGVTGLWTITIVEPAFRSLRGSKGFLVAQGQSVRGLWTLQLLLIVACFLAVLIIDRLIRWTTHLFQTRIVRERSASTNFERFDANRAKFIFALFSWIPFVTLVGTTGIQTLIAWILGLLLTGLVLRSGLLNIALQFSIASLILAQVSWIPSVITEWQEDRDLRSLDGLSSQVTTVDRLIESTQLSKRDYVMIIFDELSWSALSDAQNNVNEDYATFGEVAEKSLVFNNLSTVYAFTEWAVPSMFNGISNYGNIDADQFSQSARSFTFLSQLQTKYDIYSNSASLPCNADGCSFGSLGTRSELQVISDMLAVIGSQHLPQPLSSLFPSTSTKFRDFWNTDGVVSTLRSIIPEGRAGLSIEGKSIVLTGFGNEELVIPEGERPRFIVFHSYAAHHPWTFDDAGQLMASREPNEFSDAYLPFWCSETRYICSEDLNKAAANTYLYGLSTVDEILSSLIKQATDQLNDPVFIITSDHGTSFPVGSDGRRHLDFEIMSPLLRVPFLIYDPQEPVDRAVNDSVLTHATVMRSLLDFLLSDKADEAAGAQAAVSDLADDEDASFTMVNQGDPSSERGDSIRISEFYESLNWEHRISMTSTAASTSLDLKVVDTFDYQVGDGNSDSAIYQFFFQPNKCNSYYLQAEDSLFSIYLEPKTGSNEIRGWAIAPRGEFLVGCHVEDQ